VRGNNHKAWNSVVSRILITSQSRRYAARMCA
jgi:hypothetical protein